MADDSSKNRHDTRRKGTMRTVVGGLLSFFQKDRKGSKVRAPSSRSQIRNSLPSCLERLGDSSSSAEQQQSRGGGERRSSSRISKYYQSAGETTKVSSDTNSPTRMSVDSSSSSSDKNIEMERNGRSATAPKGVSSEAKDRSSTCSKERKRASSKMRVEGNKDDQDLEALTTKETAHVQNSFPLEEPTTRQRASARLGDQSHPGGSMAGKSKVPPTRKEPLEMHHGAGQEELCGRPMEEGLFDEKKECDDYVEKAEPESRNSVKNRDLPSPVQAEETSLLHLPGDALSDRERQEETIPQALAPSYVDKTREVHSDLEQESSDGASEGASTFNYAFDQVHSVELVPTDNGNGNILTTSDRSFVEATAASPTKRPADSFRQESKMPYTKSPTGKVINKTVTLSKYERHSEQCPEKEAPRRRSTRLSGPKPLPNPQVSGERSDFANDYSSGCESDGNSTKKPAYITNGSSDSISDNVYDEQHLDKGAFKDKSSLETESNDQSIANAAANSISSSRKVGEQDSSALPQTRKRLEDDAEQGPRRSTRRSQKRQTFGVDYSWSERHEAPKAKMKGTKLAAASTSAAVASRKNSDKEKAATGKPRKKKPREQLVERRKPSDSPRRPRTAYNFFFRDQRPILLAERESGSYTLGRPDAYWFGGWLGKEIGKRYNKMSPEELAKYQEKADKDMERYRREMSVYQNLLAKKGGRAGTGPDQSSPIQPVTVHRTKRRRTSPQNECKASPTPPKRLGPKLLLEDDPRDDVYIEETAFLYHDPPSIDQGYEEPRRELPPLPPPPPPPQIPTEALSGKWDFDQESRVLLADFTHLQDIPDLDKEFLMRMMQRDDITVVSEGLLDIVNPEQWSLQFVETVFGNQFYHKIRRFERRSCKDGPQYVEMDGHISMRVADYFKYLRLRNSVIGSDMSIKERSFEYTDDKMVKHTIRDVSETVLYMIDVEMKTHVYNLDQNFQRGFKIKEMLPGGVWCMMNKMAPDARPFMGPNLYLAPPGGFTHLHQDGHGTVDSGHYNAQGYNEVTMLRRLTERHKEHACQLMAGIALSSQSKEKYDALYALPHGDSGEQGDRPDWPHNETIKKWREMNYCPSVFILKPNQYVHINKGRLHAFRKMTLDVLPDYDCHKKHRESLIQSEGLEGLASAPNCVSVAFDWMYLGYDADGINREVASILECAALCRQRKKKSLATPEVALLSAASRLSHDVKCGQTSLLPKSVHGTKGVSKRRVRPSDSDVRRGILPSVRHVIQSDLKASRSASSMPQFLDDRGKVSIDETVDMWKNRDIVSVDPRGNDYYCLLCHVELSNVYMHCDGCEELLGKDFNICTNCHREKAFVTLVQMHATNAERKSTINHTGDMVQNRRGGCPCRKGQVCAKCSYCTGCSCRCHTWFTMHRRYRNDRESSELLRKIEAMVDEPIQYSRETEARLKVATDRHGRGLEAKRALLADRPRNKAARNDNVPSESHHVSRDPGHPDEAGSTEASRMAFDFGDVDEEASADGYSRQEFPNASADPGRFHEVDAREVSRVMTRACDTEVEASAVDQVERVMVDEPVQHSRETEAMLKVAVDRHGKGLEAKRALLADHLCNKAARNDNVPSESHHVSHDPGRPNEVDSTEASRVAIDFGDVDEEATADGYSRREFPHALVDPGRFHEVDACEVSRVMMGACDTEVEASAVDQVERAFMDAGCLRIADQSADI